MGKKYKLFLLCLGAIGLGLITTLAINLSRADVLNPAGLIARKEFELLIFATLLMLVIVVPVLFMTFFIAWKYREGNKKARYTPEWDGNRKLETIWWGFPLVIILVLSVVTWQSSHELDPFKPIKAEAKTMTIQVVALQWKWLFIYPNEEIAMVNEVRFPADTPVKFEITSDAPMNSFWIPRLGGQMYAMSGMSTELNLMADKPGIYQGRSANISGEGFAGMKFNAVSMSQDEFDIWLSDIRLLPNTLDMKDYQELARPSTNNLPAYYSKVEKDLYNKTIMKYMAPGSDSHSHAPMEAH